MNRTNLKGNTKIWKSCIYSRRCI